MMTSSFFGGFKTVLGIKRRENCVFSSIYNRINCRYVAKPELDLLLLLLLVFALVVDIMIIWPHH